MKRPETDGRTDGDGRNLLLGGGLRKQEQLLRWHGSKRALAPKVVALFPRGYERMLYCEPFCGSAAVFWSKRPSRVEVLNDLNEELMNFLATVKLHPRELARALRFVPNSRGMFAQLLDTTMGFSSVWRAARFCLLSHTSYGGLREHWAPEARNLSEKGGLPKRNHLNRLQRRLFRWAARLSRATPKCAPWQEVVEKYDSPGTLFYFDPPYLGTRSYVGFSLGSGALNLEFAERDWRELRRRLGSLKGKFILSAEGTARMKLLFRGFRQRLTAIRSSLGPDNGRL